MDTIALDAFDTDTHLAVGMVRNAIRLAQTIDARPASAIKADASPVTIADLAIQALVSAQLEDARPQDALMAEEDPGSLHAGVGLADHVLTTVRSVIPGATLARIEHWIDRGASSGGIRCWTLDPIDGTKGFLRGRQYVVALALLVNGRVQLSVVGCPRLSLTPRAETGFALDTTSSAGGLAIAVRGRGTWWSLTDASTCWRLGVSACTEQSTARVVQSVEPEHGDPDRFARTLHRLGSRRSPHLMDSQAKHVTVAAGISDLLMRFPPDAGFHDAVWDQAAGSLLVEEAGGRVTDLNGRPLDFTTGRRLSRNTGLLASNGQLHDAALDAIRRAI